MIGEERSIIKQTFKVDIPKLYELLVLAGHFKGGGEISMKEKLECISRMVDMDVIRGVKKEESEDMMMPTIIFDLSSENFVCEIEEEEVEKMATKFLKVIEAANESEAVFQTTNDDEGKCLGIDAKPRTMKVSWDSELVRLAHKDREVICTLDQPSGKFDYMVKYLPPPSFFVDLKDVIPDGWEGGYGRLT